MSFADNLKSALPAWRSIPGSLGLRPHRVYILDATFSGDHTGAGTKTETATEITEAGQPPKVRWLNDEQLALANLGSGAVDIGPITSERAGSLTLADIAGRDLANGGTHKIRLVGPMHPDGATYSLIKVTAHRALHYMLRARPLDKQET